jgi:uncharacterized protein
LSTELTTPVVDAELVDQSSRETPSMHRLAEDFVKVERISNSIGNLIFFGILLVGLFFLWLTNGINWLWWIAAGGVLVLLPLLVFSSLFWPRIVYNHARWQLDGESLEIRRGVLWKHRISVPLGRVQHADVSQGPLLRQFGLGKLTIHTAGTSNATVELNGLSHDTALAVRDQLIKQTQSKSVT